MKRIITCSDGTWNHPGEKDMDTVVKTNVQKIYEYIAKQGIDKNGNVVEQCKFYDTGVGSTNNKAENIFEGITGEGLDQNIKDAYRFIAEHFEPGDEIYLYGFSRGAYTARSTAGFIRNSGVLKRENLSKMDEAFGLYRDKTDATAPDAPASVEFKKANCYEPRIHLIGVWDTVGSLGIPLGIFQRINNQKYAFHDVTLSSKVDFAFHALAIHERRLTFRPTLWEQSANLEANFPQVLEQVWFSGVHSNVGGGYKDSGLSDTALKWMMCRSQLAGLQFKIEPELMPDMLGALRDSSTWYYKLLGLGWRDICKGKTCQEKIHRVVVKRDPKEIPSSIKSIYQNYLLEKDDEWFG